MQERTRRQQKILSLIRARQVGTQSELASLLEKAGYAVTQSSVSRDLEELGIVKLHGYYAVPAPISGGGFRGLKSLQPAGENLIVGHCDSGMASAITVEIDRAKVPGIVGTIAGDDTIFVAVSGKKFQASVTRELWQHFATEKEPS
jgi:transcriptional regulator of arginine metabolism